MFRDGTAAQGREDGGESPARAHLQHFLQENAASLQAIICGYVAKTDLARDNNIEALAAEIFQDAVLETLAHAERFDPQRQARPWFLAIAINVLKRHQATYFKRSRFEVLTGGLVKRTAQESEQDLLDQIMGARSVTEGPEQALVAHESADELLALVEPEDAQLLNMALIQGWDANTLGQTMGITPGAARVRVHRALSRLRAAWQQFEQRKEHDGYHG